MEADSMHEGMGREAGDTENRRSPFRRYLARHAAYGAAFGALEGVAAIAALLWLLRNGWLSFGYWYDKPIGLGIAGAPLAGYAAACAGLRRRRKAAGMHLAWTQRLKLAIAALLAFVGAAQMAGSVAIMLIAAFSSR